MSERTVCEIKPLLCLCLLFGYYHDFHPSNSFRLLAKLYCILLLGVKSAIYYMAMSFIPCHFLFISFFENASMVLIPLIFKIKPIIYYYKYMPHVDGIPISKKFTSLNRIVSKVIPIVLIVETIFFLFVYCADFEAHNRIIIILYVITSFTIQIGMLPIVLTFLLFYYRVKIMRETLETNDFDNTPRRRFQPRRYVQMYETLMNTLKSTNLFVKVTGTNLLSCSLLSLFCELFLIMSAIQESINIMVISFARISMEYILEFQIIIISAILSDLIKDNLQKMLVTVIDKRMNCNNERERDEIQTLYQLLRTRPYVYTLAVVVPLQLSSLLNFISYVVTTLIAILQIKRLVF